MAGGNTSKTKGSGAERELAKFLSDLFGASFIRSNSSGAYIGGRNNYRKGYLSKGQQVNSKGDIVPPDHMQRLVIESKFYKDFGFHLLLQPEPHAQLETWIGQALDVVDDGDFWIICWKINRLGWYIAIPEEFFDCFLFENYLTYNGPRGSFAITDLKSFFLNNKHAIMAISA